MLFLQCLADRVSPDVVVATASLLHAMGGRVLVPQAQHCCGLPAFDAGDWDIAGRMAGDLLDTFAGVDDVVTPAPSCLTMLQHHAPRLFRDDPVRLAQARDLHARVFDLVGYLTGPAGLPAGALDDGDRTPVTVHRFCQSSNVLGRSDSTERLLASLCNVEAVPLAEAEVCCGFGGSVSLTAPEVSAGILERKVDNVVASGAHVVISDNPGCLVHLRGGITARGERIEVLHLAEYLARRLPAG